MPPRRKATAAQREQWAEQRQNKLAELHTQLVDQVATLTDGAAWRAWLSFASRFHGYSFNNLILIQLQRPDATWVAGIKRWNSMGRRVRKGEHGIAILAPVTARIEGSGPDPADPGVPDPARAHLGPAAQPGVVSVTGAAATAPVEAALARLDQPAAQLGRVLRGFKVTTVFDIAQTEGDPIDAPLRPALSDVDAVLLSGQAPPGVWDALVGIASEHGYQVERGFCDGANGYIRYADHLIKVRDDVDDAQAVKTLAHELGHMLLHDPGDFVGGMTGACRGAKEVEAESTAFLVAAHTGLDTSSYTFGYVTGWAEQAVRTTGKTPHEIVAASGTRVVRAATQLTTALDEALGHGEPQVPPALAAQVAAGVQAAAQVRTSAQSAAATQASLVDAPPPASRAFPRPASPPGARSSRTGTPIPEAPSTTAPGAPQADPRPSPTVDEGATMTTPEQPAATAAPDLPAHHPAIVDLINIRHWLASHARPIPDTPSYLVDWLHELIATVATDPELTRLARLSHTGDHLRRFGALLHTAIGEGWAAQELTGEELFEHYVNDDQFRSELHATAGIAAYTATRADTTLPAGAYLAAAVIPPRRQQILVKAITDHAPRYHATIGSPARYIAEAHVPGGATSAEWNWIDYHIAAHPDVLQGPVLSTPEVNARNHAVAAQFDRDALSAFEAGEHQRALDLIDDAELHDPGRDWESIRAYVRQNMDLAAAAPPPAAGAAFPHRRQVAGEPPEPGDAQQATATASLQRGIHQ